MNLVAQPLSQEAFAAFGEVIEVGGAHVLINAGKCRRYTDLMQADIVDGALGLSLFEAEIRPMPHHCDLLERHPLGNQCFMPMGNSSYLVVVAPDQGGVPGTPVAFLAQGHQGVNIARNTWHGVLCPISGTGLFTVLDRIGTGANLEEHVLAQPVTIRV